MPLYNPSVSAAAAASDFVKITGTVLTGTTGTVTFSNLPQTYRNLRISMSGRTDGASDYVFIRFNDDASASYDEQRFIAQNATNTAGAAAAQTRARTISFSSSAAPAGYMGVGEVELFDYAGTTFNKVGVVQAGDKEGTAVSTYVSRHGAFFWRNGSAITSISLISGTGNFIAGCAFAVYGIN